jgi:signal peptidase II
VSGGTLLRTAYAALSLSVLLLDQATKLLVTSTMALYASVPVIPGLFHITVITNRGALFGIFHNLPDPYRAILFTAVPVAAVALMLTFQLRTAPAEGFTQTGLALILGGAVGNLVDRIRLGYVVDFLDVFVGTHHWPAFNVADASICVGVGVLLTDILWRGYHHRQAAPPPGA